MKQVLSVIVPVFNKERYIEKCVSSIQKWGDGLSYEIILVDDGSVDSSGKIIDKIKSSEISDYLHMQVFHIKNQGVAAARNFGIDKATGEWITFVDADDEVIVRSLDYVFKALTKDRANDIVICGAIKNGDNKNEKILPNVNFSEGDKEVLRFTMTGGISNVIPKRATTFMSGCKEKFYRKDFLVANKIRFEEKLKRWEDVLFSLRCYEKAKRIQLLSKTVYVMNTDPNGITHSMPFLDIMYNADFFLQCCHNEKIGAGILSKDEFALFDFTTSLTVLYEGYKAKKSIGNAEYKKLMRKWFSNLDRKEIMKHLKICKLSKPKAFAAVLCRLHLYYLVGIEMDINNKTRRV